MPKKIVKPVPKVKAKPKPKKEATTRRIKPVAVDEEVQTTQGFFWFDPEETKPPLDSTLLLLIIEHDKSKDESVGFHPYEDTKRYSRAVGFNDTDNVGEEEGQWYISGWNWEQDYFTETDGKIVRWAPFPAAPEGFTKDDE